MTNTVGCSLSMLSTNSDVVSSNTLPNCGLDIKNQQVTIIYNETLLYVTDTQNELTIKMSVSKCYIISDKKIKAAHNSSTSYIFRNSKKNCETVGHNYQSITCIILESK